MSLNAIRFSRMHTQALGALAYMGIADAVAREREATHAAQQVHADLMSEVDQMIFNAFYADRFASAAVSERTLARTDCLAIKTVTVYRSPRAARRAALSTH